MAEQPIEINLPSELYERIRRVAEERERPVQDVLVESLSLLFGATAHLDINVLDEFTDQQLWAVVHQRLESADESRLRNLLIQSKETRLSTDDQRDMEGLIQEVNRQMLLRSEALVLLKRRGHDIESYRRPWARNADH